MANNLIQVKRTSVSGRAANSTTLPNPGELALNMTDGILYSTNGSTVFEIGANNTNATITNTLTAGNGVFSGNVSISGNLVVNGGIVSLTGNVITFTDNMLYLNQGVLATITNITSNGTHVVFTANNNFSAGWDVFVSGVDPSSYNGNYIDIAAANSTTFTVANTNTDSYVGGGTARGKTDQNPDLGIAAGYNDGTYHHTGIFRDASDSRWKVYDNYAPEPDASPYIDTTNSTFHLADFQANTLYLGNTTTNWVVANSSEVYHTGAVNTATLLVRGAATVNGTLTVNAISANGGVGTSGQVLFTDGAKAYWNSASFGVNVNAQYVWTNTHTFQNTVTFGNSTVNSTVNSTFFTGTANDTSFVGSVSAANVVSNAQLAGNLSNYQTTVGLAANVATLTSNNATHAFGKTEGNLNVNSAIYANNSTYAYGKLESDLNVNNATYAFGKTEGNLNVNSAVNANNSTYVFGKTEGNLNVNSAVHANNSSYAFGKTENNLNVNSAVYANDSSYLNSKTESNLNVNNALTANYASYVNANTGVVSNSSGVFVNSAYIATLDANNASYLGTVAAASYVQNTESRILSGNLNFTGTNNFFTTAVYVNNAVINSSGVYAPSLYGNLSGNVVATTISGNLTGNVSATSISGNLTGNVSATIVNASSIGVSGNVTVGSNVSLNTSVLAIGNSTANVYVNTTAFVGNVVATSISGNLTGNVSATTLTGNLTGNVLATTLSGNLTAITANVTNKLQIGTPGSFDFGSNAVIEIDANGNTYVQVVVQNANTGNNASADLVVTHDQGNDSVGYVDLGINGSQYNQAGFSITGANDAYLYASDGHLAIGTASDKEVIFHAGGTTASDRRFTINSTVIAIANEAALVANGSTGTAGHVLRSNSTGVYWAADDAGVTSVASGNGITGGTITGTGTLYVTQGTGIVVNTSGVHVNSAYINTISANSATYLGDSGNFGNSTGIYTTGLVNATTVNATTLQTGAGFSANTSQVVTADLLVTGNLVVNGTTVTLNTATLDVKDLNITLAKGTASAASANGAGITVDGADATLTYINASNTWLSNINFTVGNTISNVSVNSTAFIGNVVATALSGNLTGNVAAVSISGNLTGNVVATTISGNLTGNVIAGTVNATTVNATSSIVVGANVTLTTANLAIGNSTANVYVNSTAFVGNTTGVHTGNVSATTLSGNLTGNVVATTISGNLTGNVVATTISGNLTGNVSATTVSASANIAVGANVLITTANLAIGNSTANVYVNSTAFVGNVVATSLSGNLTGNVAATTISGNLTGNVAAATITVSANITIDNDKSIYFKTKNTAAMAMFVNQLDDNFVFYTTNTSYQPRPVWSIYANSDTSNISFIVPVVLNSNLYIGSVALYANGSPGSTNQVLTSNGSATYWSSPGAVSVDTAAQYTWTNTQTFSANISFTGNGIGLATNTGAIYLGGIGDANWKIGRNTNVTTKWKYTNNTIDIITANSNLEGMTIGLVNGNSYFETGYLGTFISSNVTVGNSTSNVTINSTAFVGNVVATTISGNLTGNVSAVTISGNLTGDVSATTITGNLTGNVVAGTVNATTINATSNVIVGANVTIDTAKASFGTISTTNAPQVIVANTSGTTTINANFISTTSITGNLTGNVVATTITGNLTGNVAAVTITGNLTGNVAATTITGNLTGNVAATTISASANIVVGALLVANTTVINATHLEGVAATSYVNTSGSYTLSGNLNFTGSNTTVNAIFRVVNSTANVFFLAANGNIGVGNNTPAFKLRVDGTSSLAGAVSDITTLAAGNTTITGFTNVSGNGYFGGNVGIGNTVSTIAALNLAETYASDATLFGIYGAYIDSNTSLTADRGRYSYYSVIENKSQNKTADGATTFNGNYYGAIIDVYNGDSDIGGDARAGTIEGLRLRVYQTANGVSANTIDNMHGNYNILYQRGSGVVSAAYGTRNLITAANSSVTGNITTAYGVSSVIESNTAMTIGTGYLFRGLYQGSTTTTPYGIHLTGETTNYLSGNTGIGNSAPTHKLRVEGTASISSTLAVDGIATFNANTVITKSLSANGTTGTAGFVLVSGATTNTYWRDPATLASNNATYLNGTLGSSYIITNTADYLSAFSVGTSATAAGEIRATGDITAFYSDVRLKNEIRQIENALEKVNKLTGVTYKHNELAASFGYVSNNKRMVGVLAHEIETVLPEAVSLAPFDMSEDVDEEGNPKSKSGENYKTVKYDKIVPLLIEAIKELSGQVDELKKRLGE